jgi:hypothetical protein
MVMNVKNQNHEINKVTMTKRSKEKGDGDEH